MSKDVRSTQLENDTLLLRFMFPVELSIQEEGEDYVVYTAWIDGQKVGEVYRSAYDELKFTSSTSSD